jgi:hypothetical protein
MKTLGAVILILGCAAWSVRETGAGQSVSAPQEASSRSATDPVTNHSRETDHVAPDGAGTRVRKPSDDQKNQHKVSGNKPSASDASQGKANHRTGVPKSRERSAWADSMNSDRPGSDKSAGAARNGLARNETVNHAPSNRAPSAVRPSAPSLSNVRHRGPNPPIVGGVGNSNSKNTAALDGTHMNHKRTGN